jgi:hypothetical protein
MMTFGVVADTSTPKTIKGKIGERLVQDQEVAGSNPVSPTPKPLFCKPFRSFRAYSITHTGTRLGTKLA